MRVTPITALRGRILHCTDCGRWCRVSALRTGTDCCPRCGHRALVVGGTGRPHRSEPGTVSN